MTGVVDVALTISRRIIPEAVPIVSQFKEAMWLSGLGCWICNLDYPGSNPDSNHNLDWFSVVPSSTPQPHCVTGQLAHVGSKFNAEG